MQVEMCEEGRAAVARLSGEIDHHTAQGIREKIDERVLEGGQPELILDFSGVTFMDSSGVGLILGRKRLMEGLGGKLTVRGVPPSMRRLMAIAGIRIK